MFNHLKFVSLSILIHAIRHLLVWLIAHTPTPTTEMRHRRQIVISTLLDFRLS